MLWSGVLLGYLWKLTVSMWVVISLMSPWESNAEMATAKAKRRAYMDDRTETWRSLWNVNVRGTPLCIAECANDVSCASVFYMKATGECQGHSVTFGHDTMINVTGSKYYVTPFGENYIVDECVTSSDCVTANAECRNNVCMCIPGYSFSPRTHECIDYCAVYGDDFMPVHDHFISKNNMEVIESVSLLDCFYLCRNRTSYTCVSLEYGRSSEKCFLANVTVLDLPHKWYADVNELFNITYYQRDCL